MNTKKFELVLLKEGETLWKKAGELIRAGRVVASMGEIEAWVKENPTVEDIYPIVIADPTAEPRIEAEGSIIQVPAYAIVGKGRHFPRGFIDLHVPMWPVVAGGQLAILTSTS